jgi:hypothetical protein
MTKALDIFLFMICILFTGVIGYAIFVNATGPKSLSSYTTLGILIAVFLATILAAGEAFGPKRR